MDYKYNEKEINDLLLKNPIPKVNEDAVSRLVGSFSEFKSSKFYGQSDKKIPYLVFYDLSNFLLYKLAITPGVAKDSFLIKTSKFISDLYDSDDKDLKDLVLVGIFEIIGEDEKSRKLIPLLSINTGKALCKFLDKDWT